MPQPRRRQPRSSRARLGHSSHQSLAFVTRSRSTHQPTDSPRSRTTPSILATEKEPGAAAGQRSASSGQRGTARAWDSAAPSPRRQSRVTRAKLLTTLNFTTGSWSRAPRVAAEPGDAPPRRPFPWLYGRAWAVLGDGVRPEPSVDALPRRAVVDESVVRTSRRQVVPRLELLRPPRGTDRRERVRPAATSTVILRTSPPAHLLNGR